MPNILATLCGKEYLCPLIASHCTILSSGSQSCLHVGITMGVLRLTDAWVPPHTPPEILLWVWGVARM